MKITILFLRRNKYSIMNVYYIIARIHFVVNGTFKILQFPENILYQFII
jgi:hypothetical protein